MKTRAQARPILLLLALAACSKGSVPDPVAAVQDAAPAVPASASAAPLPAPFGDGAHDYQGTLGKQAIAMHLVRAGAAVHGAYLYRSIGRPIALQGTVDEAGAIALTESSEGDTTGTMSLRASEGSLVGDWTDPKGAKSTHVQLLPGVAVVALESPEAGVATARCRPDAVSVSFGAVTNDPGASTVHVVVTNRSTAACSVEGHPVAELLAASPPPYSVPDGWGPSPNVVLAPGGKAHAEMQYLGAGADNGGTAFVPVSLAITLPGAHARSGNVPWPYGPVLDQRAASHPGTWIKAFVPGG